MTICNTINCEVCYEVELIVFPITKSQFPSPSTNAGIITGIDFKVSEVSWEFTWE